MTRTDLINHLIAKYGYKSYLEVGLQWGEHFRQVNCPIKHSIDPNPECQAMFVMKSDQFFTDFAYHYDIIFIDGLHIAEQVSRDIAHSLRALNKNGVIICHDCIPLSEEAQRPVVPNIDINWQGNVWRAIAELRLTRPDLEVFVIDADCGLGVIRPGQQELHPQPPTLDYRYLERHRTDLLNLISPEQALDRL